MAITGLRSHFGSSVDCGHQPHLGIAVVAIKWPSAAGYVLFTIYQDLSCAVGFIQHTFFVSDQEHFCLAPLLAASDGIFFTSSNTANVATSRKRSTPDEDEAREDMMGDSVLPENAALVDQGAFSNFVGSALFSIHIVTAISFQHIGFGF